MTCGLPVNPIFPAMEPIPESLLQGRYLGLLRRASYTQTLQTAGRDSFDWWGRDVLLSLALPSGVLEPTAAYPHPAGESVNANARFSPCHYANVILLWAPGGFLPFKNSHFVANPEPIAQDRSWKAPVPLTRRRENVTSAGRAGSSLSYVKPIETFPAFVYEKKAGRRELKDQLISSGIVRGIV